MDLKPVEESVALIFREAEYYIKTVTENERKKAAEKALQVTRNREIIPKLTEFLQPWELSVWGHGSQVSVDLENIDLPETREKIRKVIKAVGNLEPWGKWADDPETFRIKLRAKNYPTVVINYTRKARPTDRCKILEETRTELNVVCDL